MLAWIGLFASQFGQKEKEIVRIAPGSGLKAVGPEVADSRSRSHWII